MSVHFKILCSKFQWCVAHCASQSGVIWYISYSLILKWYTVWLACPCNNQEVVHFWLKVLCKVFYIHLFVLIWASSFWVCLPLVISHLPFKVYNLVPDIGNHVHPLSIVSTVYDSYLKENNSNIRFLKNNHSYCSILLKWRMCRIMT